jgi:hypothetical protein
MAVVVLASGFAWWRARRAAANAAVSAVSATSVPRGVSVPKDAGTLSDAAAFGGRSAGCANVFVPSVTGATRTYELRAGGRVLIATFTLTELRRDDEGAFLDWSVGVRAGSAVMPPMTVTTRCSLDGDAQAPWANLVELLAGVRHEGRRFAIPARAAPGDQWDSDAVWRTPDGLIREVRHARATGREPCDTPRGTRDCLRYEFDLTISDESTGPAPAATTHATGVEWVSEGIGLVRSVLDDGSGLGPRLTLTEMRDP